MTIFFTSDTHFGHKNLLTMPNGRPFKTIEEHDQAIIDNWNSVVKPGDLVYILGDVSMGASPEYLEKIFKQLQGASHLLLGNHDRKKEMAYLLNKNLLQSLRDYHELKYKDKYENAYKFILFHFPILEFNGAYRKPFIHLYGHIHSIVNYDEIYKKLGFKAYHVGLDTSDAFPNTKKYCPISIDNILLRVEQEFNNKE